MSWQSMVMKGALKRLMPFKPQLRRFKRRFAGYDPEVPNLWTTIADLQRILAEIDKQGTNLNGITVLEIGSGWFPVIPMILRLKGVEKVYLTDIEPYMDPVSFEGGRQFVLANLVQISKRIGLDPAAARAMIEGFNDLAAANLVYLCPFRAETIANASIDLVVSRTVLEHIPPDVLPAVLGGLVPKLRPGGYMVHVVDESDHLEHRDKSISRLNFLTLPGWRWAIINWCWDYQNRLRHHEYLPLFERAGLRVVEETAQIDTATLPVAGRLRFAPPYNAMTPEQLAVLSSTFVLAPRTATA